MGTPIIMPLDEFLLEAPDWTLDGVELVVGVAGFPPNGQKSPPSGGKTHVSASPSSTSWKFDWMEEVLTVLRSMINGAGFGVESLSVQLGPRAPMKEVFPKRTLSCTVKFVAELMAIA